MKNEEFKKKFDEVDDAFKLSIKVRDAAKLLLKSAEKEYEKQKLKLSALERACIHDWKYDGEGRHGSSKGYIFYKCRICGGRKRE